MANRFRVMGAWLASAILLVAAAFSMWLATGRSMQFLDAPIDDLLFVRQARFLLDGAWLGPYDNLTLAKGPGFPAFVALARWLDVPLRLAEHAVYLLGCWLVCRAAARLAGRWCGVLMFAAAAVNPVLWGLSLDRVVRENLYLGQTVLLLGLGALVLLVPRRAALVTVGWSVPLGLVGGWFWLTREEGLWIAPALAIMAADWLVRLWVARPASHRMRHAAAAFTVLTCPVLCFLMIDFGVAWQNHRAYGVWETNEFRSPGFRAAYGALSRIRHDEWQRLIPVPRDARARAYEVSPAFRELRPFLDGPIGNGWHDVGCRFNPIEPCTDIQGGWFMWALRQATSEAGHFGSAQAAEAYYTELAHQVDTGCKRGALACVPARSGFIPPWRTAYLAPMRSAAWWLVDSLVHLGSERPGDRPSDEEAGVIAEYRRTVLGSWSPAIQLRSGPRADDVHVLGWGYGPAGPISFEVQDGNGAPANAQVVLADAPPVRAWADDPHGSAVYFDAVVLCGAGPCDLVATVGDVVVRRSVASLLPDTMIAKGVARVFLSDVVPLAPEPSAVTPRMAQRAVFDAANLVFPVLLPCAVLALAVLVGVDLRHRRVRRSTVLWLAMLAAIAARVLLLALLTATSVPAVSTLYLSPVVGVAMLFTAGVLADGAARLRRYRKRA